MKTGLSIGIHIEDRLRASEALQSKISGRVFPIAAVSGTQKPYICYTRTGITPDYTKDGWAGDTVNVAIEIVADGYKSAVELAELVREQLEDSTAEYGECTLDRINVNGNYEPSNCRFVNMKVQAANRRNSKTAKDGE